MKFEHELTRGKLVKRYKRFLAAVALDDGRLVTAHCANPGSMLGLQKPGSEIWLSPNQNPKAKLDWRWELASQDGQMVGINTTRPNSIVADAIRDGQIAHLKTAQPLRREVKYGKNSRIDILLEASDGQLVYVEVKNVTLSRPNSGHPGAAEFPDSVTRRGTRHLEELTNLVPQGHRAVMFYLVQREDCDHLRLASDIDPAYKAAFDKARAGGVEMLCYGCRLSPSEIIIDRQLPVAEN